MSIINSLSPEVRHNLRTNMHKVAAKMVEQDGFPVARDEITLKEAAYQIGARFYKHYLEKKAMLEGIVNAMQLRR